MNVEELETKLLECKNIVGVRFHTPSPEQLIVLKFT